MVDCSNLALPSQFCKNKEFVIFIFYFISLQTSETEVENETAGDPEVERESDQGHAAAGQGHENVVADPDQGKGKGGYYRFYKKEFIAGGINARTKPFLLQPRIKKLNREMLLSQQNKYQVLTGDRIS